MVDLLDILLDAENTEPINMTDGEGNDIRFEQVAIVPHEGELYCILKPLTKISGVADDEAIVFRVDADDDGTTVLVAETNELVCIEVFQVYYDMFEESGGK